MTITDSTIELAYWAAAKAGQASLHLPAGVYPPSYVRGLAFPSSPMVLTGEPGTVLQGLVLQGVTGLTLDGLEVQSDPRQGAAIVAQGGSGLTLKNLDIHGASVGDGQGVRLMTCPGSKVDGCQIHHLSGGIGAKASDGLALTNNLLHDIEIDGVQVQTSSHVTIDGNHFTNFYPKPGDHADAIQFVQAGQTGPITDITISNNLYTRGAGTPPGLQGIFIGDEQSIPYQRVTITGNAMVGCDYNGVLMSACDGLTMTDNLHLAYADHGSWFKVYGEVNATITRNVSTQFQIASSYTGNVTVPVPAVGDLSVLLAWQKRNAPVPVVPSVADPLAVALAKIAAAQKALA